MQNEKRLVPELRFPEFKEDWERSHLNNVTSYVDYRGRAPQKSEQGHFLVTAKNIKKGFIDYNCSKEYVDKIDYSTVMSKGRPRIGDVLFTTEAPMGNVAQVNLENIALAQRVIKFRGNDNLTNSYLLYYMLSSVFQKAINKKAIGTTVQGISGKELHKTKISYPGLKEQQKIATFLTAIDNRLQSLEKKKSLLEEYKKGLTQQLFKQELRFRPALSGAEVDDEGKDFPDWEKKKLGTLLDYEQPTKYIVNSTEYNDKYKTPVLTAGKSFILGYTNETENIYQSFPVIIFDDFTMATQFVAFPFKVKSSAMKILKNNPEISDIRFLYNVMQMINYPKGDEHKRFWISAYSKIKISFPCLKEQTKIANFLSAIDKKIELVDKQIEKTKTYKKGLLQQMFV
ncbi:restriction endonuclease subunit S [Aequorivita sp. 609]|uniref:restriction endonuclease subunit S n=1 Tax=Aequorivita TaxID=153265 RepID=UPI00161C52D7|nr:MULTISPECIES: restriction endonuclease subunit S [Aequorivita]MBB6679943.1 restriction endonuclease subunit S [Aequorivita sp. 609]